MLSGVLPFTGGDALVYGEPISSEGGMDRIRSLMGVCPQFDVLWGELTGTEHLLIYGHVKGLPYLQVKAGAGGGQVAGFLLVSCRFLLGKGFCRGKVVHWVWQVVPHQRSSFGAVQFGGRQALVVGSCGQEE